MSVDRTAAIEAAARAQAAFWNDRTRTWKMLTDKQREYWLEIAEVGVVAAEPHMPAAQAVERVKECAALFKKGGGQDIYESAEEVGDIILEALEEDG